MLDAMLLLDLEDIASGQRAGLTRIQRPTLQRPSRKNRIGLYVEREFAEGRIFNDETVTGRKGKPTQRSTGPTRIKPIAPRRGSSRVGSEGSAASVVAAAVKAKFGPFSNHPGPDLIRSTGVGIVCIVTDFIGSGTRVNKMLDLFWKSASIRSWWRLGWLRFSVVAGCSTKKGMGEVMRHRFNPEVIAEFRVPTISEFEPELVARWVDIMDRYGPAAATPEEKTGYKGSAALVAFTYGLPNNTPLFIHGSGAGWKALYAGSIPSAGKRAFHPLTDVERVENAIEQAGLDIDLDIGVDQATLLFVLSQIRGKLRPGAEDELSERTGLSSDQVRSALSTALTQSLLAPDGHLTEDGQRAVKSLRRPWRRPDIPTNQNTYYPWELRDPRVSSSNRRLLPRRPR